MYVIGHTIARSQDLSRKRLVALPLFGVLLLSFMFLKPASLFFQIQQFRFLSAQV